ncbi:hypothetical protein DFH07DRAFT_785921 [Mycena maculata]|uniref:Uncharacterized protein n=1 Tax=Mycena maculata TaxID=230809 RepID=A0AAD7H6X8_9AGAR|nr:hypothetical protein DFH07DRAFT_785921 [Mycena maculata]
MNAIRPTVKNAREIILYVAQRQDLNFIQPLQTDSKFKHRPESLFDDLGTGFEKESRQGQKTPTPIYFFGHVFIHSEPLDCEATMEAYSVSQVNSRLRTCWNYLAHDLAVTSKNATVVPAAGNGELVTSVTGIRLKMMTDGQNLRSIFGGCKYALLGSTNFRFEISYQLHPRACTTHHGLSVLQPELWSGFISSLQDTKISVQIDILYFGRGSPRRSLDVYAITSQIARCGFLARPGTLAHFQWTVGTRGRRDCGAFFPTKKTSIERFNNTDGYELLRYCIWCNVVPFEVSELSKSPERRMSDIKDPRFTGLGFKGFVSTQQRVSKISVRCTALLAILTAA